MRPECQHCQEWMEEAFGGELGPDLLPVLEKHLAGCEECRASWEEYRLLRRGLDFLEQEEDGPSPFVERKILRAAAERNAAKAAGPSRFWHWLLRPATIGFATLTLIAGLGYLGREELLRHRRADDLTAPVALPPAASQTESGFGGGALQEQAPAPQTAPAQPSGSLGSTAPATIKPVPPPLQKKPQAEVKAEKPASEAARQEYRQSAPPTTIMAPAAAPVPAEEKSRAVSEPLPAANGGALKGEGRAREKNIPEAEVAAPAAPKPDLKKAADKDSETAGRDQTPAKTLQRAAPPQLGAPAADKADDGVQAGLAQKEIAVDGRFEKLLQNAKAKISRQDYAGGLDDLLAAQKIRDNKEVQDLILLCRSHLRGDG